MISEEIEFRATDIEISNDQNLTIANNGSALIKDDELIVEGKKMKYFRNESLLIIYEGLISSLDQNFKISSFSFFFMISKKKSCVDIRSIKGNISSIVVGTSIIAIKNGK